MIYSQFVNKIANAVATKQYEISTWIPTEYSKVNDEYKTKDSLHSCNIIHVKNALIQTAHGNFDSRSSGVTFLWEHFVRSEAELWVNSLFDPLQQREDFDTFYAMGAKTTQTCLEFQRHQDRLDISLKQLS